MKFKLSVLLLLVAMTSNGNGATRHKRSYLTGSLSHNYPWPRGVVPFTISDTVRARDTTNAIQEAMG